MWGYRYILYVCRFHGFRPNAKTNVRVKNSTLSTNENYFEEWIKNIWNDAETFVVFFSHYYRVLVLLFVLLFWNIWQIHEFFWNGFFTLFSSDVFIISKKYFILDQQRLYVQPHIAQTILFVFNDGIAIDWLALCEYRFWIPIIYYNILLSS